MRRGRSWMAGAAALIAAGPIALVPVALVPLALVPVALGVSASPASAQAVDPNGVVLHGQIEGEDGRAVNALLGFDFVNAEGRHLRRDGCVQSPECPFVGYASVVRVNPKLSAQGSPDRSGHETAYSVQAPAGTAGVFVEVYPQNERLKTDEARYGHAMRHTVAVPLAESLDFRLPLTDCSLGGTVGSIFGTAVRDGAPLPLKRVVVWSNGVYSRQSLPIVGWNIGTASADASFRVPHLPPGQTYTVWLTAVDGSTFREPNVSVEPCTGTGVEATFSPAEQIVAGDPPAPPQVPDGPQPVGEGVTVTGVSLPGVPVQLWAATPGSPFRLLRSTVSSDAGDYLFIVNPTSVTQLRVRIGGQDSPAMTLHIRPRVSLEATRTGLRTYTMSGRVTPARGGVGVEIRHVTATGERVLLTPITGPDGRFVTSRRFLGKGPVALVARSVGHEAAAPGRSAVIRPFIR